jgi:hypothetical protein
MKIIWLNSPLLVLCVALVGYSQNAPSTTAATAKTADDSSPILLPVKVSGKWGYVNGSGQLVINPQFDNALDFHEGRAAVCLGSPCSWWLSDDDKLENTHWGYIDAAGKMVISPQYGTASTFKEGVATVCTGDCSSKPTKPFGRGYIDHDGKVVIPTQFGIASDFSEGLAYVCVGKCTWEESSEYDGKVGFIDHSGHFVINPQYDNAWDFKNGFAKVALGKGKDAKTGYVDKTGKMVWQPSN